MIIVLFLQKKEGALGVRTPQTSVRGKEYC